MKNRLAELLLTGDPQRDLIEPLPWLEAIDYVRDSALAAAARVEPRIAPAWALYEALRIKALQSWSERYFETGVGPTCCLLRADLLILRWALAVDIQKAMGET